MNWTNGQPYIVDNAELTSEGSLVMDWNTVKNFRYTITDDITTDVDATISQITSPRKEKHQHFLLKMFI